jgi:hypothetical protein
VPWHDTSTRVQVTRERQSPTFFGNERARRHEEVWNAGGIDIGPGGCAPSRLIQLVPGVLATPLLLSVSKEAREVSVSELRCDATAHATRLFVEYWPR